MLKGKNIQLRALEQTDINLLFSWENNSSIWKISNTLAPYSRFALEQYLHSIEDIYVNKQLRLVIVKNNDENTAVGCIDLFDFEPHHHRAGVGILLEEQYRGNGFANEALELLITYAFNTLLLKQLYCNIGIGNLKSLQLFENAGFKQSGLKKSWNRIDSNTFEDELFLQLIKA